MTEFVVKLGDETFILYIVKILLSNMVAKNPATLATVFLDANWWWFRYHLKSATKYSWQKWYVLVPLIWQRIFLFVTVCQPIRLQMATKKEVGGHVGRLWYFLPDFFMTKYQFGDKLVAKLSIYICPFLFVLILWSHMHHIHQN